MSGVAERMWSHGSEAGDVRRTYDASLERSTRLHQCQPLGHPL